MNTTQKTSSLFYKALLALGLLLPSLVWASNCQSHVPFGNMPVVTKPSMLEQSQALCFDEYMVFFSGKTKTPLWASELLTPQRMSLAQNVRRQGEFYEEKSLGDKASLLSDYRYSGYDRGHMAPSADFSSVQSQQQSYSLANIVPQVHEQNAGAWLSVEKQVRKMAYKHSLYVITGVLFEGNQILFLKGRVAIPTSMYKVIYNPQTNEAGVYLVPNTENAQVYVVDLNSLQARAGVDFQLPNPSLLPLPAL